LIDYYGYITTMSWRAVIALEELGLEYRFTSIDLGRGEQASPEHTARNPMQKVPVIVDHDPADGGDPVTVFESGAILIYLAEKTGRLMPTDARERAEFFPWFFWVVNGYGPALGWTGAAFHVDPKYRLFSRVDYGETTYRFFTDASVQAHAKLDERLAGRDYICGDYSIADIAAIGSTVPLRLHGVDDISQYPNLARWYDAVRSRPAVKRGLAVGREADAILPDYYREALFDDAWADPGESG
jgi:GST-like protein